MPIPVNGLSRGYLAGRKNRMLIIPTGYGDAWKRKEEIITLFADNLILDEVGFQEEWAAFCGEKPQEEESFIGFLVYIADREGFIITREGKYNEKLGIMYHNEMEATLSRR